MCTFLALKQHNVSAFFRQPPLIALKLKRHKALHLAPLVLDPGDAPGPVQGPVCPEEAVPGVRGPVVISHQLNDLPPDNLSLLLGPHRPGGAWG